MRDDGAGGARREEISTSIENSLGAGRRGAEPARAMATVRDHTRADEDAAAVIAVVCALAATAAAAEMTPPRPRSVWKAGPARSAIMPGPHAWWASGLPR